MYLNITNHSTVSRLRRSISNAGRVISGLPSFPTSDTQAAIIKKLNGEKVGYVTFCTPNSQLGRPGGLMELGLLEADPRWNMIRLLPNLMRSLKLNTVYVSSDNLGFLRTLFHFPFNFYHVFQTFRVNSNSSLPTDGIKVRQVNSFQPRLLGCTHEKETFGTPLYNKVEVQDRYAFRDKDGFIGYVASHSFGADSKQRALFPSVLHQRRRNGLGSAMICLAAKEERKKKREPILIFEPEDAVSARLANRVEAEHSFDLLEIRPSLHLSPVKMVEAEFE